MNDQVDKLDEDVDIVDRLWRRVGSSDHSFGEMNSILEPGQDLLHQHLIPVPGNSWNK